MSVSLQMRAINGAIPFPAIFVVKGSLQESDAVAVSIEQFPLHFSILMEVRLCATRLLANPLEKRSLCL